MSRSNLHFLHRYNLIIFNDCGHLNVSNVFVLRIPSPQCNIKMPTYSPNDGTDRKLFFKSLLFEESEDENYIYNFICGDYNCALDKNIDRHPIHARDDVGLSELCSIIEKKYLCDVWRKLNPEKKKRYHSKSRIDFGSVILLLPLF